MGCVCSHSKFSYKNDYDEGTVVDGDTKFVGCFRKDNGSIYFLRGIRYHDGKEIPILDNRPLNEIYWTTREMCEITDRVTGYSVEMYTDMDAPMTIEDYVEFLQLIIDKIKKLDGALTTKYYATGIDLIGDRKWKAYTVATPGFMRVCHLKDFISEQLQYK